MNRSTAFCLLLGLQLSHCMSINKTSVSDSVASNNSTICTAEWENASPVDLCKIYNWFGGLTNLFRKTGEVVSEIEDNIPTEYVDGHFGYGDQVKTKNFKTNFSKTTLYGRFKSMLIMRTSLLIIESTMLPPSSKVL